ncbi:MAG: hypothetical protein ACKO38_07075 [Planctomycetota bacterium]
MDALDLAGWALRWVHILTAITLMGGAIFQRFALMPAAAELDDAAHERLKAAVRGHWSKMVMMSAGGLLLSGLVNVGILIANYTLAKPYHMIFGIKFLLALVVLYIASLLAGRSAAAERARQNARNLLTVNLVLATIVVCLGGYLRIIDRTPKGAAPAVSAAPSAR